MTRRGGPRRLIAVSLTNTDWGTVNALIRAEARRLDVFSYQHEEEYPPRLKKLRRIHNRIMEARHGITRD